MLQPKLSATPSSTVSLAKHKAQGDARGWEGIPSRWNEAVSLHAYRLNGFLLIACGSRGETGWREIHHWLTRMRQGQMGQPQTAVLVPQAGLPQVPHHSELANVGPNPETYRAPTIPLLARLCLALR